MGDAFIAITIARQLGAGGAPLGKRLAQRLGFRYLDDELLRLAAEKCGVEPGELAKWDEHRAQFWERLTETFSLGMPDEMYVPPAGGAVIHDREVFELQAEVMRETAARESCIFIGRAGFWALRDHPGRVSVYLHAPAERRVPAVMDAFKVDAGRARELIQTIDADRARFIRETTGAELTPQTQHLCIDTGAVSLATAEEMVARMVEERNREFGG